MSDPTLVRGALVRTCVTVVAAILFGLGLGVVKGQASCLEFFSGYLVEQSLSVDNLFVFIMLFEYFRVPAEFQQRVLSWGIAGAIIMRGIMIVAGVAAVKKFRWMTLLFAGILLLSSVKLLMESEEDEHELTDNIVVKLSRRLVGATSEYDGDRFFTEAYHGSTHLDDSDSSDADSLGTGSKLKSQKFASLFPKGRGGEQRRRKHKKKRPKKVATPLLLTLVCVELSDVVFAVDSIPAVLGISTDPLVVYSSNIFAIIGLRALYTLVAKAVDSMVYLKPAVCIVLLFISLKMILEYFYYHLSTQFSLGVVVFVLGFGALLSLCHRKPNTKKHEPPTYSPLSSHATNGKGVSSQQTNGGLGGNYTTHRRSHQQTAGAGGQSSTNTGSHHPHPPEGAYSPTMDISKVLV